jgi:uracil-DNA glycosylase
MAELKMETGWKIRLEKLFQKKPLADIRAALLEEKKKYPVYPPGPKIFAAFDHTPWDSVRVVILGQDPYHSPGQANGLCFSVESDLQPLPPSLKNIYKELEADLGITPCPHGDLRGWARQGVLLLNNVLTVRGGSPQSHQHLGWSVLTDEAVRLLSEEKEHLAFMLWGSSARAKAKDVDCTKHLILESSHPSPLSNYRGFSGCRHFSKTNEYLISHGIEAIDWDPCAAALD